MITQINKLITQIGSRLEQSVKSSFENLCNPTPLVLQNLSNHRNPCYVKVGG